MIINSESWIWTKKCPLVCPFYFGISNEM